MITMIFKSIYHSTVESTAFYRAWNCRFRLQEERELLGTVLLQMVQLTGDENCAQVMYQALQHAPQKAVISVDSPEPFFFSFPQ